MLAAIKGRPWSTALAEHLARTAHDGENDKIGVAYINHPGAVAALVEVHGEAAQQVAWLHDVVEDTAWTLDDLRAAGHPGSCSTN